MAGTMVETESRLNPQTKLIEGLQSAQCYPHKTGKIKVIETHISWVLLTGEYAYKIKKSVNFGFLDFSSLEKRKFYCDEELRLNKRFSSLVYLDVVPITENGNLFSISGAGKILEYAVLMRQFPGERLLSDLAKSGKLDTANVYEIAVSLSRFHADATKSKLSLDAYEKSVGAFVLDNFRALREKNTFIENEFTLLNELERWTRVALEKLDVKFTQRYEEGMIRECHGDLHLGNITLMNNKPVFFDCIEFNPSLANIDTMSELAFLLMDLERLDLKAEANALLNRYLLESGDYTGLAVLNFYKVYRAMVRAKILKLRLLQVESGNAASDDLGRSYLQYLNLAYAYIGIKEKSLIITHGLSGSGKTTKSRKIASELDAVHIQSDVERKRLFKLGAEEKSGSAIASGIYSDVVNEQTYRKLYALTDSALQGGFSTIVDASFLNKAYRDRFKELAARHKADFKILYCHASTYELEERLTQRSSEKNSISEADTAVMHWQLKHMDPLTESEMQDVMGNKEMETS